MKSDRVQYSELIDEIVYSDATMEYTREDWLWLALAALDQAGAPAAVSARVTALLPENAR